MAGFAPNLYEDALGGIVKLTYDFAEHGGAVGDIVIPDYVFPDDAMVIAGGIKVVSALTSGGSATVAMSIGSALIKTATAIASYTNGVALNTLPIRVSGNLKLTVATAALTGGKLEIVIIYA